MSKYLLILDAGHAKNTAGKKAFDNSFYAYEDKKISTDDALKMWHYLARKYASNGYIVKGIAINEEYDNDEMYVRLGMEKYRCFFKLITDNAKNWQR